MKRFCQICAYGAMVAIILALMTATVLEKLYGTPAAVRLVYHNPLFLILWGICAISGLVCVFGRGVRGKFGSAGLHVALAVILAGALLTFLFGESGVIHLREGEEQTYFIRDDGTRAELPFALELEQFDIARHPDSGMPSGYSSAVTILPGGRTALISMNHILKYKGYRFCQADYDADGLGSILRVNHDPWGIGVTYTGYGLLLLCMIGFFFQRDTAFRRALGRLSQGLGRHSRVSRRVIGSVTLVALLLWLFLTGLIVQRWQLYGTGPFVGRFNVMILMAWFAMLAVVLLSGKYPLVQPFGFLVAGFALLLARRAGAETSAGPLMPVLQSPLLSIHVLSMMLSYTLFGLVAFNGIAGLSVRSREVSGRLKDASLAVLYPAVFLLTFGTFIGAVWANISWGNYWTWDPKETWALVTLLIYAFTLQDDALRSFRNPRFFHGFTVFAFLSVLVTYFGVNFILGGMHAYA